MKKPPATSFFNVNLKKSVYNDSCNCEVVVLRIIAKTELNFFNSLFYQFCQVISTISKINMLEFIYSPKWCYVMQNFQTEV